MQGGNVEAPVEDADGPLPTAQALGIAKRVCRGLTSAHEQGVVHRDLKSGNFWLTADGTAKIGDFGLAVAQYRTHLKQHVTRIHRRHGERRHLRSAADEPDRGLGALDSQRGAGHDGGALQIISSSGGCPRPAATGDGTSSCS